MCCCGATKEQSNGGEKARIAMQTATKMKKRNNNTNINSKNSNNVCAQSTCKPTTSALQTPVAATMQSTWPTTCKCTRCTLHECTQVISYCSRCCCCCCSFPTQLGSVALRPKACLRNCRCFCCCLCCCCCSLHVHQGAGNTFHLSGSTSKARV